MLYCRYCFFIMKLNLSVEDFTIILNALHYYKKVEKRGNFQQYDEDRINDLRDKLAFQFTQGLDRE
ncbi:hypothetical protein [Synechococcus phage S-H34]|uniref:Uncharacterized protein n=1 Tax=Synechococcus phage S-H34 TaxID=2718942 RepID=A0A6G8R6T4_9CAUD|nr:hypothetical protein PQC15_gp246 [Synechococcus phage S-H34]QIN97102.1 hypothetical protein [Synechococcus phage S-H34]